ncbi:hypothetical protein pb186bvf_012495 [Paramecium bursaria]
MLNYPLQNIFLCNNQKHLIILRENNIIIGLIQKVILVITKYIIKMLYHRYQIWDMSFQNMDILDLKLSLYIKTQKNEKKWCNKHLKANYNFVRQRRDRMNYQFFINIKG